MKDFVTKSTFNHTDKYGVVRAITIAVVVSPVELVVMESYLSIYPVDTINRRIGVGIAIQNPLDELNLEIGDKIAIGRAKKPSASIASYMTDTPDIVPNEIIAGILDYYQLDFVRNPDKYLKISEKSSINIAKKLGKYKVEEPKLPVKGKPKIKTAYLPV